jgi:hypothetical protein
MISPKQAIGKSILDEKPSHATSHEFTIRARAFIAAFLIIPADNYWVLMMEKVREGPYPTTISLFANAIFILAVLVGLNTMLRRLVPRFAFTSAELLLIYAMTTISAALAGHDMLPTLVGMMTYPWWFATPENRWAETFLPHLPGWLSVTDPAAMKGLWEGNSSLYKTGFWLLWLKPVLWWVAFMCVLTLVMMCINTLVRCQWTERERLSFPIVQLPLAMTEPKGEMWRSRLFWSGFLISGGIVFLNGLSVYTPAIPKIDVGYEEHNLAAGITSAPWSAIGWMPYSFYPFAIGLGYLLPADLVFSCWFFYLFWKMEHVAAAAFGLDAAGLPFAREQAFGGLIAIVISMVWASRSYLKQVWLRAINRQSELDDSDEAMSYRSAIVGSLIGLTFLSAFMIRIGMSPLLAVAAFLLYFIIATAIARIRAELGPPVHDFHFSGPDSMITTSVGIGRLSNGDFVGLAYFWWFNRAYRAHPMPIVTEGIRMADASRSSRRVFMWGMLGAVAIGTLATFWAYLDVGYRLGFSAGVSQGGVYASGATRNLELWWARPMNLLGPNWGANAGILAGFVLCMLMSWARWRIAGWPFHPIGFALSASYQINLVWVPLLIAWVAKTSVLRFGGLRSYKNLMPFFLGLILGEMSVGCMWSLIGIVFGIPYYNFWGA